MDPLLSGTQSPQMPLDVVMLTPATIADYSKPRHPDLPAVARTPATEREYRIRPGDMIRVTIYEAIDGTFHAPVNGGSVFDQMRVDSTGGLTIPFVHPVGSGSATAPIKAAGLTRQQLRDEIVRDLQGKANQPQAQVELLASNDQVSVSGDVKAPGMFPLVDGPQTVLDAIDKAGGPNQAPLQTDVVVRRKDSVTRMSMVDLMLQGGDSNLHAGDDIIVENSPHVFFGMGAIKFPSPGTAAFPFPRLHPSLQEALATMGGLADNQADPTGIFVFRGYTPPGASASPISAPAAEPPADPTAKPKVIVLDYTQPTAIFLAQAFMVEPGDTIFVTNAPVYQVAKVVSILSGAGSLATSGRNLAGQ
jgi:polysaccharide export outer membrane protein